MKLAATYLGKKVFNDLKSGEISYDKASINQDEWAYLGFVIDEHYINYDERDTLERKYGTEGVKIYNRLINKGYVQRLIS